MNTTQGALNELPPAVRERIGFLLARTHMTLLGMLTDQIKLGAAAGATGRAFGCLSVIADEGPLSQQALGRRLDVDRTSIVMIVDVLEAEGLVERERNPSDRRAYALRITPAGRKWLQRATRAVLEVEREFLAPLSPPERKQLIDLLQRLLVRG
jgi:DNA-binding MarR family transcriptional regulator